MALVRMARWIWLAVFGSGLRIGLPLAITKIHPHQTRWVQSLDRPMCCEAVRGISMMTSFVPRIAAHILRSLIWVLDSDVLWMRISKENISSSKEQ